MAWAFHDGIATPFKGPSNNFPITLPAITIGDLLFLIYEAVGVPAEKPTDLPAGWALIDISGGFSTGVSSSVHILTRTADGTEGATVTILTTAADNNSWIGQALSYRKVDSFIRKDDVPNPATGVMTAQVISSTVNILRVGLWSFQSGPPATAAPEMTIRVFRDEDGTFGHSLCWSDEVLSGVNIPQRTPNNNAQNAWGTSLVYSGAAATSGFGFGRDPFGP